MTIRTDSTNDPNDPPIDDNEPTTLEDSTPDVGGDPPDDDSPQADPVPPMAAQPPPTSEPKVIQIPSSSMKRIKEEERQRGRASLSAELNAEARKLGFRSHEEMIKHVAKQRSQPKQQPAQQAAASTDPAEPRESPRRINALERDVARLTDERKRQNRRVAELEKENKRLKAAIDSKDAEGALRVAAAKHGVQDIEYALHVLQNHLRAKSEDELRTFDEDKFFADTLRNSHPYLYGVETRPATSSPSTAPTGKPTPPRAEPPASDATGPVDARKMSPQEYQELLRKRGITDPSISSYVG